MAGIEEAAPGEGLITLALALERIRAAVSPVPPRRMHVAAAAGSVLAEDVIAPADVPQMPVALSDGWAVNAADTAGATPYSPVPLSARPAWVEAGEPMPPGCDAVLEAEDLDEASPVPQVLADIAPGTHVRPAAGEARSGQVLAEAGLLLTPATTGALAGCGIDVVMVRRPRMRLTMTGDIGAAARADAVAPTIGPLISSVGVDVVTGRRVGDDPAELTRSLRAPGADAIIMVGGTGFGRRDETLDAADAAGTVLVEGVMLAPGETSGFAMVEGRPVLMLSARPDAALAGFLALGLPLLDALSGTIFRRRPSFGRLTRKVASRVGVAEIVFVRWREEEVEPLGGVEAPLSVLARAQGWLAVPPESEGWPQGERVEVHQL